jgi:hypothetical protein
MNPMNRYVKNKYTRQIERKLVTMYNTYLYDKVVQNHRQELLKEAEQQRMLSQLSPQKPQLMQYVAKQFTTLFKSLQLSNKKVEQSVRPVTGQL